MRDAPFRVADTGHRCLEAAPVLPTEGTVSANGLVSWLEAA